MMRNWKSIVFVLAFALPVRGGVIVVPAGLPETSLQHAFDAARNYDGWIHMSSGSSSTLRESCHFNLKEKTFIEDFTSGDEREVTFCRFGCATIVYRKTANEIRLARGPFNEHDTGQ